MLMVGGVSRFDEDLAQIAGVMAVAVGGGE